MNRSNPDEVYIIAEAGVNHNYEGDPAAQGINEQKKYWEFFGIPKNEILLILGLYIISHIYILFLGNSVFWDDWTIFNTSTEIIIDKFRQAGAPFGWTGYLHAALFSIGPWVYKLLTFIIYFFAGIFLLKIIERQSGPWVYCRVIIVILFMILPLNSARIAAIDFPYAVCYFAFFLAWFALDRYRRTAFALFLFSFNTNSLLVFFAIPVFDYLLRHNKKSELISFNTFKNNWGLFSLPFLYFGIKQLFFKPTGLYEGYNSQISLSNIPTAIRIQLDELHEPMLSLTEATFIFFATILLAITLYRLVSHIRTRNHAETWGHRTKIAASTIFVGCLLIALAEFPYLVLGHAPRFYNWDSRHQLLMPLGVAILLYGIIFQFGRISRKIILSGIIGFFVICNIISYWGYYIDWQKQKEIIRVISNQNTIKNGRLIVFEDHTEIPNARGRTNSFYEWNGILSYSYGDEKRFGINQKEWSGNYCLPTHVFFSPHYKAGEVKNANSERIVLVKIFREGDASKSVIERLKYLASPKLRLIVEDDMPYCRMM